MNRRERRRLSKLERRNRGSGNGGMPEGDAGDFNTLLPQAIGLLQGGAAGDALHICQQILAQQPTNPDALNLCAVAHFHLGNVEPALRTLQTLIEAKPDHLEAYNNLGNIFRMLGRFDAAEAAYRQALEIDADYFDAHYNLGITLESVGRLRDAGAAYRKASELKPDFPEAFLNLGNVLKALGAPEEAIAAYHRALDPAPENAAAHNNIGNAYYELRDFDQAKAAYRRALEINPDFADAHYNLGVVLQEREHLEEAVSQYRRTLELNPDYVKAHINLGYALHKRGEADEAVAAYKRAIELEPANAQVHANLGDVLLQQGKRHEAVALCDAYLQEHPGNTGVLAFKAVALHDLGKREQAHTLVDFDRLIQPSELQTPPGFASLSDFNAALAHYVRTHPTLVSAPTSHATRFGKHSGELLGPNKGPIAALESQIRAAVEDYRRSRPADSAHPFLTHPPKRLRITAWGVVLGAQGHQVPHIHPSAWLSGVYYVRVPRLVDAPEQRPAGWIEFGRPPEHFHCQAEPEVRLFQPKEGLMLLFPSYFYHRTIPFSTEDTRISIAFDVSPLPGE